MAQRQNLYASILAALNLAPTLVRQAQQSGAPNEVKHSRVVSVLVAAAQLALPVAGALISANNPLFAPLIDAAVKVAVETTRAEGTLDVPPVATVDPNAASALTPDPSAEKIALATPPTEVSVPVPE